MVGLRAEHRGQRQRVTARKPEAGSAIRSRLDEGAAVLDDPYIRGLMAQALKVAGVDLKKGSGEVVLKSTI